jgi:iron(III) transport system substrate-binding protein
MKAEGDDSPADVLMTVDIGKLVDLVESDLTQPIQSKILESVIPANLRDADGQWYALSLRDRSPHPYNTVLVAALIAHNGPQATEQWLRGVKANLAREAAGGDRDVAHDILAGVCDAGLADAYYAACLKNAPRGTDARQCGNSIKVIRPTFADKKNSGTHVNISGAAVAKHAPHKKNAVNVLEYLVSKPAQSLYAQVNFEYPVRAGVKLDIELSVAWCRTELHHGPPSHLQE